MWHPGVNEIEWLADLKPLAQDVGEKVLGYPIRWSVETAAGMSTGRRCDVRIETDDGRLLFTGEAKRPDDPKGQHPLVTSEVDDAVAKAQAAGAQYCFTTNFLQIAVLDAGAGLHGQPLRRLQGNTIPMVDPAYADTVGWWKSLTDSERRSAASDGLRMLFERFRDASAGAAPPLSVDHVAVDYFRALTDSLLDPLHKAFDSVLPSVSPGIHERALRAGLDLSHPQQRRYLIAQGITEVLTAVLFQQVLRGYFTAIEAPLGGMTPQSPQALRQTVISALDEAVHISGDYKPILVVSEIAEWVLGNAPEEAMPHWWELLAFIERLDVNLVTGDILGTIFERLISPERRHDLGQHYTQPRLARAMAHWGVREPDDVVLDPACGAGTFLVETYGVHKELGVGHGEALRRTFGNDIDAFAVHLASINLATRRIKRGLNHPLVRHGDAFDLAPENVNMLHVLGADDTDADDVALTRADLVIANPPYGRSSRNESAYLAHLHGLGMQGLPTTTGINLAAWFVLLGAGLLTERGRMAFVLPSAVLQNENLASWRAWLRRRYEVVIWHTEADVWFSDARVAACVMLMTPAPPPEDSNIDSSAQAGGRVVFVDALDPVDASLHYPDGHTPAPCENVTIRDLSALPAGADLLIPGTLPDALLRFSDLIATQTVDSIAGATVAAGQKLGHKFFKLTDADPTSTAVMRTVTGLSTTIRVNGKYLLPLLSSAKNVTSGAPTLGGEWLLNIGTARPSAQSVLGKYLQLAESQGVHTAPSQRGRSPWWSLPAAPTNIAVAMNQQFRHQVAWLNPPAVANNNFNTVTMADPEAAELVAASLASAFGGLAALYRSGELGCEGARRILLAHFQRWTVLDPAADVAPALRTEVLHAYRAYRQFKVSEYDMMPTDESAALSRLTRAVAAYGNQGQTASSDELADGAVAEVIGTVARRRRRESQALAGRTRSTQAVGSTLKRRIRRWCAGNMEFDLAIQLLTSGTDIFRLRTHHDIDNPQLFQTNPFDAAPDDEHTLANLLGTGFEAAFPHPDEDVDELIGVLAELTETLTTELLPPPPPTGDPASETWNDLRAATTAALQRNLQTAVRDVLS